MLGTNCLLLLHRAWLAPEAKVTGFLAPDASPFKSLSQSLDTKQAMYEA